MPPEEPAETAARSTRKKRPGASARRLAQGRVPAALVLPAGLPAELPGPHRAAPAWPRWAAARCWRRARPRWPARTPVPLPRPNNPVTWPVFPDNKPIASGLQPETGATLQIYNWVAYVNQACLNHFAKKYNCKVQVTTFNTMNEALSKLRSGLNFDVFMGVTVDVLGQLIESKLIQPLNHSYIPNITQAWPDFTHPFYDRGWQYTTPYTIYTTGISWRKDLVHENPYAMRNPWAHALAAQVQGQGRDPGRLPGEHQPRADEERHLQPEHHRPRPDRAVPAVAAGPDQTGQRADRQQRLHRGARPGRSGSTTPGPGDMAAAPYYMPKGVPVRRRSATGSPPDGRGPVANDTLTVLQRATNPVLAHLFLNYLLDLPNVLENISYNGYMQPLTAVTPQRLVKEQLLPKSLISTAVLPSDFRRGVGELQLPVDADALWQQAWLVVSNGI